MYRVYESRIQSKYADRVTDVLKDIVSFAVTRLNMAQGVAVGIVTWIICQNL